MAAVLERRENLYLLESDEGLTVHYLEIFDEEKVSNWQSLESGELGFWDELEAVVFTGKLTSGAGVFYPSSSSRALISEWWEEYRRNPKFSLLG